MTEQNTPLKLLSSYAKLPGAFAFLDNRRERNDPTLPFCPSEAAAYYLASRRFVSSATASLEAISLASCYMWHLHKRIYVFDEALSRLLVQQAEDVVKTDTLPVFTGLPVPAFYIQAPGIIAEDFDGFFVWEETTGNDRILQFAFLFKDMRSVIAGSVALNPEAPLSKCLPDPESWGLSYIPAAYHGNALALKMLSGSIAGGGPAGFAIHNMLLKALQLVFYISCANADISPQAVPAVTAGEETTDHSFVVGRKIGEHLRREAARGNHAARKAHTRKGHWHSFWVGPRNGERKKVLKWVAPVFVGSKVADVEVIAVTE